MKIFSVVMFLSALAAPSQGLTEEPLPKKFRDGWASPNHRMSVEVTSIEEQGEDVDRYALILNGNKTEGRRLLTFARDIDVYWSPKNQYIAITKWTYSNFSECFIFFANDLTYQLQIYKLLPKNQDFENSHLYVQCLGWRGPTRIAIRVSGHKDTTPSKSFDYRFLYDTKSQHLLYQNSECVTAGDTPTRC